MDISYSRMAIHTLYAGVLLLVAIRVTTGALVKYPTDVTVTVGQPVILPCKTNLSLPVYWYFNNHEIFYGGRVSMSFQAMFTVFTNETGVYNLSISSANESYIGEYVCGDDEGQGEKKSAHLYVTAPSPFTEAQESESKDIDNKQGTIIGIAVGLGVFFLVCIIVIIVVVIKCRAKDVTTKGSTPEKGAEEASAEHNAVSTPQEEIDPLLGVNGNQQPDVIPKGSTPEKGAEEASAEHNAVTTPQEELDPLLGVNGNQQSDVTTKGSTPEKSAEEASAEHNAVTTPQEEIDPLLGVNGNQQSAERFETPTETSESPENGYVHPESTEPPTAEKTYYVQRMKNQIENKLLEKPAGSSTADGRAEDLTSRPTIPSADSETTGEHPVVVSTAAGKGCSTGAGRENVGYGAPPSVLNITPKDNQTSPTNESFKSKPPITAPKPTLPK